jgi:hypothetical protein
MIYRKNILATLIIALAAFSAVIISGPTASAAIETACGSYTGSTKEACEKGYRNEVSCSSYVVPGQQSACTAGKTQAATDAGQGPSSQNPQNGSNDPQQTGNTGECGGTKTGVISCKEDAGIAAIGGLIKFAVNILTVIIGIVSVGGIGYAAILYAGARDNQSQVQNAIAIVRNIVIGLLMYGFTIAIINWLVPGGIIG